MKLAVFDFDGTLFPKDTLPFLLKQWRVQNMSRRRMVGICASVGGMYVRYRLGLYPGMSTEAMRRKAMHRFTHIFRHMSEKDVDAFFENCAAHIIKELNVDVVAEMKKAKAEGFHTVLLSGNYQRLIDFVGDALGFDTIIGTSMHYKHGCVDASKKMDIVCGDDKATHLRAAFGDAGVDWLASTAYGDSLSDLPILKLVGLPVAVNPEPGLEREASLLGWRLLIC